MQTGTLLCRLKQIHEQPSEGPWCHSGNQDPETKAEAKRNSNASHCFNRQQITEINLIQVCSIVCLYFSE